MGSNNHSTPQARWAVTTTLLHKLDASHRSHLRSILGMRWPNRIISNENLYVCCSTGPLSQQVWGMRRSMFGHVLHMLEDTPTELSLQFAVAGSNRSRGQVGRHTTNLFDMLRSDLKEKLRSGRDLVRLREMATDRTRWRGLLAGTDCDINMSPDYFCRRNSLMMMMCNVHMIRWRFQAFRIFAVIETEPEVAVRCLRFYVE